MKTKFKFFLMFCMALSLPLVFSSCSSDDDDDNNSIVGTWEFKEAVAEEVVTNSVENDAKVKVAIVKIIEEDTKGSVITFSADGKFTTVDGDDNTTEGTYTLSEGNLTLNPNIEDPVSETYKVSISNDILKLGRSHIHDFEVLTKTELAEYGITDENFSVTKAVGYGNFVRK